MFVLEALIRTLAVFAAVVVFLFLAGVLMALPAWLAARSSREPHPFRFGDRVRRRWPSGEIRNDGPPYRFAWRWLRPLVFGGSQVQFLDMSTDGDEEQLRKRGLPVFHTPDQLADWLDVPVGTLAWLTHRFRHDDRPLDVRDAHYAFRWLPKRSGGVRLIESPKPTLKRCQSRILDELLSRIPVHPAAHGFVTGRSIVTNAAPHVGRRVVVKLDLEGFYPSVRFNRVVAIFRGVGYSREAALWLARLCTSAVPVNLPNPDGDFDVIRPYRGRHLPQGAPTSPMLANLSAFSLDVRLAGMARVFGGTYTRYADDLTFSGDERFVKRLKVFLPLVTRIVRAERFKMNAAKRRVLRSGNRQTVTGVVVNEKPNVSRRDFDRLKAILHNCVRHGPHSQNRDDHPAFREHLRGRIAHVMQLNPARGRKLQAIFERVKW